MEQRNKTKDVGFERSLMMLATNKLSIKLGTKHICQGLTLTIQPGEFWGILGPNGSGKTSLLQTLAGLLPPTTGSICLENQSLKALSPRTIAQHIAILFQDTSMLFPQTVWEYCLSARFPHLPYFKNETEQDKQLVHDALMQTDLIELKHHVITKLSGGEKRRLAIAAVLAQTPAIFLLDEPTNHLDIRHQITILEHFRNLTKTQSKAVASSLHDMNLAQQYCNRILLLFQDGTTLQGSTNQIMTAINLSRLYQQPIQKFTQQDKIFWWPLQE